jgi:hypothetical protein
MQYEVHDYILFKNGRKKTNGFIEAILPNSISVSLAEDPQILVNLDKPELILADYGIQPDFDDLKAKIYKKDFTKTFFGKVTIFRDITSDEEKAITDAMDSIAATDAVNVLLHPINVEVTYPKGGEGSVKTDDKKQETKITLCPKAFDKENCKEVLLHQIGKAIWSQKLSNAMKEKWIKFYDKNMNRKSVADASLDQLRLDFISSGMTVSDYCKQMSDGDVLKKVMKVIKQDHNLDPRHVDILAQSGNDLVSIWPTMSLNVVEYTALVSERSTKSVEDFFAESYMFKMMGLDIPTSVDNAVTKTLSNI